MFQFGGFGVLFGRAKPPKAPPPCRRDWFEHRLPNPLRYLRVYEVSRLIGSPINDAHTTATAFCSS